MWKSRIILRWVLIHKKYFNFTCQKHCVYYANYIFLGFLPHLTGRSLSFPPSLFGANALSSSLPLQSILDAAGKKKGGPLLRSSFQRNSRDSGIPQIAHIYFHMELTVAWVFLDRNIKLILVKNVEWAVFHRNRRQRAFCALTFFGEKDGDGDER